MLFRESGEVRDWSETEFSFLGSHPSPCPALCRRGEASGGCRAPPASDAIQRVSATLTCSPTLIFSTSMSFATLYSYTTSSTGDVSSGMLNWAKKSCAHGVPTALRLRRSRGRA